MALEKGAVFGQDYTWDEVINVEILDDGKEVVTQVIGSYGNNDDPSDIKAAPRDDLPIPDGLKNAELSTEQTSKYTTPSNTLTE